MKNRFYIFAILLGQIMSIFAQNLEVKQFEIVEKDKTATLNPRKGSDGVACGLVKVQLKEPGAEFEGRVIGDVQFTGNEYLVYLTCGTKRIDIKHPDYLPTTIVFADYGTKMIAPYSTYELKIKTNKKQAKVDNSKNGTAVFNIKPSNAMLLIDGQIANGSEGAYTLSLPYGTHFYTVKLKDFAITNQPITIDKNAKNINVDLTEFFANVDVSCKTEDANILINHEQKGTGRWSGMVVPGEYTIEIQKDRCHPQQETVVLGDNDNFTRQFPELKLKMGTLKIDYQPSGSDIYLNDKYVGKSPYEKELPIGDNVVEIKKEGYISEKKHFTIVDSQTTTIEGRLDREGYSLEGLAEAFLKYDEVEHAFSEGLARVRRGKKYGFIDKHGSEVIPCIYDEADYFFHDGLVCVGKGEEFSREYGFIDKQGKEVIPCIYFNYCRGTIDLGDQSTNHHFSEGLCRVGLDEELGFLDKDGNVVIPFQYDYAGNFHEGLAWVEIKGKSSFIDKQGNEVIPCIYDGAGNFHEGLACVGKDEKWGFIDKQGNEVIPCIYNAGKPECFDFHEGLVCVEKDEKWGYIDKDGNVVIPFQFDYADNFSDGLALVNKGNKYGFIDKQGNEVTPCVYDDDIGHSYVYDDYIGRSYISEGLAVVKKNGKCGFIDKKGNEVIPCKYDRVGNFHEGLAWVEKNDKCGLIDKQGNEVIPCGIYDHVGSFNEGLAHVYKNGKRGFIDKNGNSTFDYYK